MPSEPLGNLMVVACQWMADQPVNHGASGQFVMLPSGEQVTADEAKVRAKPAPTPEPIRKADK